MTLPLSLPVPNPLWQQEQTRWRTFRTHYIPSRLEWAIQFIQTHRHLPEALRARFPTLASMLAQTHSQPSLHTLALEMFQALHPLPIWWGQWSVWERELRFAIEVAGAHRQPLAQAEFLEQLAWLQWDAGQFDQTIQTSEQALAIAKRHASLKHRVHASLPAIQALINAGESAKAWTRLEAVEADFVQHAVTLSPLERALLRARLDLRRMYFYRQRGQADQALEMAHQIIARLQTYSHDEPELLADAYTDRSTMYWVKGQYSQAVQDLQHAIHLYEALGHLFAAAEGMGNLGLVYWSMASLDLAEESLQKSITISESLNARRRLTVDVGNLGLVYLSRGECTRAAPYIARQVELAEQTNFQTERNRAIGNRGIVHLYLGNYAQALDDFQQSLAFIQARSKEGMGSDYTLLSWCYLKLGEREAGQKYANLAWETAEEIQSPGLQTTSRRCLAEFQTGAEKIATLQTALQFARLHGRRLDEAGCLLSLAGCTPKAAEALPLWQEGVTLLRTIGATGWLDGHTPENPPQVALLL